MLDNTRIRQLAHQHLTGVGDHCIINFARALIEEAARSTIAAPAQEPVYPEGEVVGPCVCGSWPGGKCFKCPRVAVAAQEPTPLPNRREHKLKVWAEYYEALHSGEKTFELRKDDRGFRAGDVLWLREWNPRSGRYSGREMRRLVTYIISGNWGLEEDVVCMALAAPASTAAPVVPEWQPIETAPLNENVLLWWRPIDDNKYAECAVIGQISFYEQGQWWNGQTGTYQDIWHVTKWMPVPAAPKPDA